MIEQEIYSGSTEMVRVAVASNREDVHTGTIEIGFSDSDDEEDEPTTYTAGEWMGTQPTVEEVDGKFVPAWVGQVLVSGLTGNGDVKLDEGEYFVFSRVTMPDGQSVLKLAGRVTIL